MQINSNLGQELNPNKPDRELIRQYFQTLKNRRTITPTTITESLGEQIIQGFVKKIKSITGITKKWVFM